MVRYAMAGNDDLGYAMLHQAIRMGETLGLVNNTGTILSPEQTADSPDTDASTKRTAWGLFHVDAYVLSSSLVRRLTNSVVHPGFLRPTLIHQVNVPRLDKNIYTERDLWTPYPTHREPRPSFHSQYFDESINLCEIARDMSRALFADGSTASAAVQRQKKEELYERLRQWKGRLLDIFDPGRRPPPHVILLRYLPTLGWQ